MLTIKILGPGCANCKRLRRSPARRQDLNVTAEFTSYRLQRDLGLHLAITGPVINEKLVSSGNTLPAAVVLDR
jgi:hypothetical protein